MTPTFTQVVPILRMFDVDATLRFYCDYLGCRVDWREGEGDRPIYLPPGTAVYIEMKDAQSLHRELHAKDYPFLNPGLGPYGAGRAITLLDPASNVLRFFEPPG